MTKMTGTKMGFWVCSRLNRLKLIRVLRGVTELGSAQGELKGGSSIGRQLSRSLVAMHGGGFSSLSHELG